MQTFKDPSQFAVIKWGKKSHEFKIPTTHEEIEDHFRVDVISFKKQSLDGDLVITDGSKLTPGFWEMDAEAFSWTRFISTWCKNSYANLFGSSTTTKTNSKENNNSQTETHKPISNKKMNENQQKSESPKQINVQKKKK